MAVVYSATLKTNRMQLVSDLTASKVAAASTGTASPDNVVFLIDYMAPPQVSAASPYPSPYDYGWSYGEPPLRPGMPGSGTARSS